MAKHNMAECMKLASQQYLNSASICDVLFGTVLSEKPLVISAGQKLMLTEEFLIPAANVTDREVVFTIEDETLEGGREAHIHGFAGRKKMVIHNGLKEGDRVILLRKTGGQRFVIIDKAGDFHDSGNL